MSVCCHFCWARVLPWATAAALCFASSGGLPAAIVGCLGPRRGPLPLPQSQAWAWLVWPTPETCAPAHYSHASHASHASPARAQATANPAHPFSHFSTGSFDTLITQPKGAGIDPHERCGGRGQALDGVLGHMWARGRPPPWWGGRAASQRWAKRKQEGGGAPAIASAASSQLLRAPHSCVALRQPCSPSASAHCTHAGCHCASDAAPAGASPCVIVAVTCRGCRVRGFHRRHYSAGVMRLAVVGRQGLDELEALVSWDGLDRVRWNEI